MTLIEFEMPIIFLRLDVDKGLLHRGSESDILLQESSCDAMILVMFVAQF